MRVRIPHLTEHDADRIAAELEREPVRIWPAKARDAEDPRQRAPRRRHHNQQRSYAA